MANEPTRSSSSRFGPADRTPPASTAATVLGLLLAGLVASGGTTPLAGQQPVPEGVDPVPPEACRAEDENRIPMLIVGSYHMANPGQDAFNLEADDVTTPRRQREIEAVVEALAAFRPTEVAIEGSYENRAKWQERYESYRAGEHELVPNEREQIGFRLADRMGLDSIRPVDVRTAFPMGDVQEAAGANPRYDSLMRAMGRFGERTMETLASWLREATVGEMLRRMNTPAALQANHGVYFEYFLPVMAADSFPGASLVESWYGRNLRIHALLQNLAEPGDRIFVIYGQGHAPTLRRFAADDPGFCLEDPLPYLEEAATLPTGDDA